MISRAEVNSNLYSDGEYSGISAEYVIAHAARQAQRGRAPSVAFLGHRNPEKALNAAVQLQEEVGKAAVDPVVRLIKSEFALGLAADRHVWGEA